MNYLTFFSGIIFGLIFIELLRHHNYEFIDLELLGNKLNSLTKKNQSLDRKIGIIDSDLIKLDENIIFDEKAGAFTLKKEVTLKNYFEMGFWGEIDSSFHILSYLTFYIEPAIKPPRIIEDSKALNRAARIHQEEENEYIRKQKKAYHSSSPSSSSSDYSSDIGAIGAAAATASFCC